MCRGEYSRHIALLYEKWFFYIKIRLLFKTTLKKRKIQIQTYVAVQRCHIIGLQRLIKYYMRTEEEK